MTKVAVAITNAKDASQCIDHVVADLMPLTGEITLISIAERTLLSHFASQTGMITPKQVSDQAVHHATQVAVEAMEMLPTSIHASYIVCRGWLDPAMRTHLLRSHHDELIVARKRLSTRRLRVRFALRGTGVRLPSPPIPTAGSPFVEVAAAVPVAGR